MLFYLDFIPLILYSLYYWLIDWLLLIDLYYWFYIMETVINITFTRQCSTIAWGYVFIIAETEYEKRTLMYLTVRLHIFTETFLMKTINIRCNLLPALKQGLEFLNEAILLQYYNNYLILDYWNYTVISVSPNKQDWDCLLGGKLLYTLYRITQSRHQ